MAKQSENGQISSVFVGRQTFCIIAVIQLGITIGPLCIYCQPPPSVFAVCPAPFASVGPHIVISPAVESTVEANQ